MNGAVRHGAGRDPTTPMIRSDNWNLMKCPAVTAVTAVTAVLLVAGALEAGAATNNFVVPGFRGMAESENGYWERFTVAYGAPGNGADQAGSTTGAMVTQVLSPGAFATGSGNIYDPSAAMAFTLADATPFTLGTVVLQIRTLGSELDYGGVRLSYLDGGETRTLAPWYQGELDRGTQLGASISAIWQWDLRGLGVDEYTISFGTPDSSLSLDAITLDTWTGFSAVPEPSGVVLLGVGAGLLALGTRVRRGARP